MRDINNVTFTATLGHDPEVRYTPGNKPVADIRVCINDSRKNPQSGQYEDVPNWVTVTVWNRQAELVCEHCSKGSKLVISGRLQTEEWTRDGQKHSKVKVVANDVQWQYRDKPVDTRDNHYQNDNTPF